MMTKIEKNTLHNTQNFDIFYRRGASLDNSVQFSNYRIE